MLTMCINMTKAERSVTKRGHLQLRCHSKVRSPCRQMQNGLFQEINITFFFRCVYVCYPFPVAARNFQIKFRWVAIWFWNIGILFRWPCRLCPHICARRHHFAVVHDSIGDHWVDTTKRIQVQQVNKILSPPMHFPKRWWRMRLQNELILTSLSFSSHF